LTFDTFQLLLSPLGQSALAAATELRPTDRNDLRAMTALRKRFPTPLAVAALETVILRGKAAAKFHQSGRMYFTREALEVASGEIVSAYRAERFRKFEVVGDFGCGIGGDTLTFAADGRRVVAVDSDPVRVRMAEANAEACGWAERVQVRGADLLTDPLPDVPAAFADPGRRAGGQRFLSIADYLPPPGELLKRLPAGFPIAYKLAPGVNRDDGTAFGGELEFISVDGELKESVLWLGELRTTARRATLLRGSTLGEAVSSHLSPLGRGRNGEAVPGEGLASEAKTPHPVAAQPTSPQRGEVEDSRHTFAADTVILPAAPRPVGAYLFDPAAALVRAELEGNLAAELGLEPTDFGLAVFTSDSLVSSPFLTAYRVDVVLPLDAKKVNAHLTAHGIGRVTVVQCGSGVDADAIRKKCKGKGHEHRFLILTKELGRPVAVVAERVVVERRYNRNAFTPWSDPSWM